MKKSILLFGIFLIIMLCLPFFVSGYWLRVLTQTFMFAAIATGSNIIIGYTGYPALEI